MRRLLFLFSLLLGASASAAPTQVIILRHAEKPLMGSNLSKKGEKRAHALVDFLTKDPRTQEHGAPAAIYAQQPDKNEEKRPVETMLEAAAALKLPIQTAFDRDEVRPLVAAIMASQALEGKTVVICWEHNRIPDILAAFGWPSGPKKWDDDDYDHFWVLDFSKGEPVRFRALPELLLPGDAKK